ncbi:MAG TPA: hypothetical protein VMS17_16470 [Gemmataceae bacterium]|nr:hypothetical protein [Gemmataceae bacterium]
MPATSVTCPFCNSNLKSKTPIPGGTKIKCPKCSTQFAVRPDDAEDVPPTVAAPQAMAKLMAKKAAGPPAAPKASAPKPAAATPPKPAASRPPATHKPAAPKAPPPAKSKPPDDIVVAEVVEDEIVEVADDEIIEAADAADVDEPVEEMDDEGPATGRRKRGGKGPARKGIPLWVWLTGGGVAAVLLLGVCAGGAWLGWSMFFGNPVSVDNYNKIKLGSTEEEVTAIMGRPTQTVSVDDTLKNNPLLRQQSMPSGKLPDMKTLVWKKADDFISVNFMKGKAVVKVCTIGTTSLAESDPAAVLGAFGP